MYLLFAVLLSHVLPAILSLPICTKCPTGGIWSRWRDTTDCTKSCGLNGKKNQIRTCTSGDNGCPCSGVHLRTVPCPMAMCTFAGSTCAAGYEKWLDTNRNEYICGNVTLPTDYVAPTCVIKLTTKTSTTKATTKKATTKPTTKKATTKPTTKKATTKPTTKKATTKATTKKATTKATTKKATTKPTTTTRKTTAKATATTPANPCARCTLAELLALRKPNSAIFTPVFGYDSVTGCAQVSGNCSGEALNDYLAIGAHAAAGPPGPFGYVCGCGSVNTKPEAPFVCSPDGKWQYGGQTIGDWYCYVYYDCLQQIAWYAGTILDACPTATPSTTTPAPLIPAP